MKQTSRLLQLLAVVAAFVVLAGSACQKKTPDRAWERGAFSLVPANKETYSLPAGVVIDSMYGYGDEVEASATPLYLRVSNTGASDVEVKFPAGLVFGASNPDYEYMIVLQDFSFTAATGGASTHLVPTYGCNEDSLDQPDEDASYSYLGREWDKETEELITLLAGKTVSGDDPKELVQQAWNEITGLDETGLTDSTRTKLQNLP